MAINETPVDSGSAGTGGSTTLSPALAGTATSGNLLVAHLGTTTNSGAITTPAGWTLANKHEAVQVSGAVFYKVSDGTETGVTITWANNRASNAWIAEFAATDLDLGTAPILVEDETNVGTSVTSQSTGTTAATTVADALCLAFFNSGQVNNTETGRSYTAGYTELYYPATSSRGGIAIAAEVVSATGTQSCTFTTTDTGDEMYGQMLVFQGSASDTTAPVLSLPTGTKTGSTTASGTVTTDEGNGTLYFTATTNATETAATIKTGSSQAVTASGVQNVSFTGLSPSTTYYAHYVQDDAATNESNTQHSTSFTTDASSVIINMAGNGGFVGGGGLAGNGGGLVD